MKERCEMDLSPGTLILPERGDDFRLTAGSGAASCDIVLPCTKSPQYGRFPVLRQLRIML
jgi:hypothetical protein